VPATTLLRSVLGLPATLPALQRSSVSAVQAEPEAAEGQPQFWRDLAAGLELDSDQRARIVHLRHVFLSKTGAMQRRRRAAAAQLEATLPQGDFNSQGGSRSVLQ